MSNNRARLRNPFGLALLGVLALAGAACGGSDDSTTEAAAVGNVVPIDSDSGESPGTPTSISTSTDTSTSTSTSDAAAADQSGGSAEEAGSGSGERFTIEDAQQAYRDFTDCMRNEGITMPPAVFDAAGKIDIDAQLDYFNSLDAGTAEISTADEQAAEEQCLPEHADELLALITPDASEINRIEGELSGDLDAQLTEIAECMRETFPDFPDPIALDLDITSDEQTDFNPFPTIDPDDPLYSDALAGCAQAVGLSIQP